MPTVTRTPHDRQVAAERVIAAPAQQIFDLLADPAAHARFDGSGTVRAPRPSSGARLHLGARFGMDMRFGVPYRITNEVVEFEEGRRIAWRHFGRHVWRFELEPAEGGTLVRETFDWRPSIAPWAIELGRFPERNRRSIEATLRRLASVVEDGPPPPS